MKSGVAGKTESQPFRADIQGLRAIAVLAVVLYHAKLPFLPGGYVGVDVFFVISGFLITSHLLTRLRRHGRIDFAEFYARRARRILPASLVVAILTVVGALLWYPPLLMEQVWQGALATALYVPNVLFAAQGTDYLAETSPSLFQHYWSLGAEEQFYLVWPLLLALGWRLLRTRRALLLCLVALAVVSFTAGVVLTYRSQPWAFFSLPTRAWELGVGGLVAFVVSRPAARLGSTAAAVSGWAGLGGIGCSIVLFDAGTPFPSFWAAVPVVSTALVILGGTSRSRMGPTAALSVRPMQFLGLISYSLYLVHWPALAIPDLVVGRVSIGVSLGIAVGCVPVAWAMYRFVETPGRTLPLLMRARARRSLWLSLAASVTVIAVASGALLYSTALPLSTTDQTDVSGPLVVSPLGTSVVPANLQPSLRNASSDQPILYTDGCHLRLDSNEPQDCTYGDADGPEIVLFGDSHAAQWFPAIHRFAVTHGYRLRVYTKASCPVADVTVIRDGVGFVGCSLWRQAVVEQINARDPELVIMSSYAASAFETDGRDRSVVWAEGLAATLQTLQPPSVLIADTPHTALAPSVCLSANLDDAGACSIPIGSAFDEEIRTAETEVAEQTATDLIDLNHFICNTSGCPAIVGNVLVYRDEHHLTTVFVDELADPVAAALERALA